MSEGSDNWRKSLKRQTVPLPRHMRADADLPHRSLRIKDSKFLGSGTSGVVRAIEAELVRRPQFLKNPVGWFFPTSRELKGYAIKIMRPGQVGEAMESYHECENAGLTVPKTYRQIDLADGRPAILMRDLRQDGYVVAQTSNSQAEHSKPTGRMTVIPNFDGLLKTLFHEVTLASQYKKYGILLGGDSIFFLMPQQGGVGEVKHLFADFDRMHNQAGYNSEVLHPLEGNASQYQKAVFKINVEKIADKFKEFVVHFVEKEVQGEYLSKLASYIDSLKSNV